MLSATCDICIKQCGCNNQNWSNKVNSGIIGETLFCCNFE